ncbi:MAG: hypothetical protein R3D84_07430 [Paracoccaceae bacterium]
MPDLTARWNDIVDHLLSLPDTARGKMMSADAVTRQGKVFAFHSTKGGRPGLGVRLGRQTDFAALGLCDWQHLAPFRTKPPMKDWIVAGAGDAERWNDLALMAYDRMAPR